MNETQIITRIDYLINLARVALANKINGDFRDYVPRSSYIGFKAAASSFIESILGVDHPYNKIFTEAVDDEYVSSIEGGLNILGEIKHEIENGWLVSFKSLVAAELFSDFFEMAEHLLEEGYKDAAAVMIGSVLEEHLRQLCHSHGVDTHYISKGDSVPKKANLINDDLKKEGIYGPIEQKQVVAWLSIRNSAAHGKYTEYTPDQVKLMYQGVLQFISSIK